MGLFDRGSVPPSESRSAAQSTGRNFSQVPLQPAAGKISTANSNWGRAGHSAIEPECGKQDGHRLRFCENRRTVSVAPYITIEMAKATCGAPNLSISQNRVRRTVSALIVM